MTAPMQAPAHPQLAGAPAVPAAWEPPAGRLAAAQRSAPYADALRAYVARDPLRLNVPGHQGGRAAPPELEAIVGTAGLAHDVPPLLWGIDRGEAPTPMDRALALAAAAWGARRTWFLTDGASQGSRVACLALRAVGAGVLAQRSLHSSVVDGIVLADLRPRFLAPTIDDVLGIAHGVTPAQVTEALARDPGTTAVYIVSPSYFGAVADVAGIARAAHRAGAALVVDEAWGSHFGFHPALPASALAQGADLVVSSTHKMAGSLTQSAMLHLGDGPFADALEAPVDRALHALQSTSASSLLYASLDLARRHMATSGEAMLAGTLGAVGALRAEIRALDGYDVVDEAFLRHPDVVAFDPLRVVIDPAGRGLTGYALAARLLTVEGIDVEVANRRAVVAVIAGDAGRPERLLAALERAPRGNVEDDPRGVDPAAAALRWGSPRWRRATRSCGRPSWSRSTRRPVASPPTRWPRTRRGSRISCPASASPRASSSCCATRSPTAATCAAQRRPT